MHESKMQTLRRVRILVGAPGWVFAAIVALYAVGRWIPWPKAVSNAIAVVGFPLAAVVLIWLTLAIVASFFIDKLRCPSCGKSFFDSNQPPRFIKSPFWIIFVTKCRHCGVRLRETRDGVA